nr:Gag-Pol polyprotein [Tanacetum cinerariifolium]
MCDSGCDANFLFSDCFIYDRKTQEHSRLGHVSGSSLRFLASTGALEKLDANDISDCSVCKLAKLLALPFGNSVSSSNSLFDLVHSDVWGPSPIYTKGGSRYYVLFIEDFTRYTWVSLMKRMFDFLTILKEFRALVKTQHSIVRKCFRNDLGGECTSNEFFGLLKSDGTIYQSSCTDTPQQNSVAERKHRHLVKTTRSFLLAAAVPNGAMVEELTALHQAHAWDLVPLPAGKHVIGSRWV